MHGVVLMGIHQDNIKQIKTMRRNLKLLRKDKKWSLEDASEISGIDLKTLKRIERNGNFGIGHLLTLCRIYGVKAHKIFMPIDQ